MNEHVLGHAEGGRVQVGGEGNSHLEPPHVSRISGIFQTVLVAFQEEFQLEPEKEIQRKLDNLSKAKHLNMI